MKNSRARNPNLLMMIIYFYLARMESGGLKEGARQALDTFLDWLPPQERGVKTPLIRNSDYNIKGCELNGRGRPCSLSEPTFFIRGLPRLSVCVLCSHVQTYGGHRCNQSDCNGRTYELLSDRGSGEPFFRIWVPMLDGNPYTTAGLQNAQIGVEQATTYNQPEGFGVDARIQPTCSV